MLIVLFAAIMQRNRERELESVFLFFFNDSCLFALGRDLLARSLCG